MNTSFDHFRLLLKTDFVRPCEQRSSAVAKFNFPSRLSKMVIGFFPLLHPFQGKTASFRNFLIRPPPPAMKVDIEVLVLPSC